MLNAQWQILSPLDVPQWFAAAVRAYTPQSDGKYAAQLLWQRGIHTLEHLECFANPDACEPTSPFEFGQEMKRAVKRLCSARQQGEKVAIWGDFDADGITSTSVLWDGLGQFFQQGSQLSYTIPNRLTESHGLNVAGIERLAAAGTKLIVTCDTGSTNLEEIDCANSLGLDIIVTDHHTLPPERPPVVAIINPRYFAPTHPLFHLSGVAVAYKLVEALYATLPEVPQRSLTELLDLVAIGLIADLVQLSGDCRYLAQQGIKQLQKQANPRQATRPGVARLLELCRRTGDRPTDISFGLGPRINAVSRIHGDASFCVELLTSRDRARCEKLALETELANTRRKELQKNVVASVKKKLEQVDLSTTSVIVLDDPQWSGGVLGLVAGQVAQEYGRPAILLTTGIGEMGNWGEKETGGQEALTRERSLQTASSSSDTHELPENCDSNEPTDTSGVRGGRNAPGGGSGGQTPPENLGLNESVENPAKNSNLKSRHLKGRGDGEKLEGEPKLARGSARSANNIDLYDLVQSQAHLLHRFGGHPFAAGLSLPVENLPLFRDAINQQLRQQLASVPMRSLVRADLTVTVAELGQALFRELKLLEPCGMGNPVPKLLIENCWFADVWNNNAKDVRGRKVQYIKTTFEIGDDSCPSGFPGVWWGHYKEELPQDCPCDAIVELDFNTYKDRYEVRLIAVRSRDESQELTVWGTEDRSIVDLRGKQCDREELAPYIALQNCPLTWEEVRKPFRQSRTQTRPFALAYPSPSSATPQQTWLKLVGLAKYLSRTGEGVAIAQLKEKLGLSDETVKAGLQTLERLGFAATQRQDLYYLSWTAQPSPEVQEAIAQFLSLLAEEQFQRHYFYKVPLSTVQLTLTSN